MSIPLFVSESSEPERTTRPLSVSCLVFERMDRIDFTGPFEVLSRIPDTTVQIIGKEVQPVRDMQGLRLSPDVRIAEAGIFDVCRPLKSSGLLLARGIYHSPGVFRELKNSSGSCVPMNSLRVEGGPVPALASAR